MTDWVRLWHDMPTDPKWRVIARKSGQPLPCVIALFNMLMVSASQNAEERGVLLGWNDEDAAAALDMEPEQVSAIIAAMQGKVLDGDKLSGWDRRQPKREDNSAERVKAYRARKQAEANAEERPETQTDEVKRNVTQRNAPDADADADADAEKDKNPPTPLAGGVPDWLPVEDWSAFIEMRRKIKKPLTGRAEQLAFSKLGQFRAAGHDPGIILQQSTLNCWQDLFPPRTPQKQAVQVGI